MDRTVAGPVGLIPAASGPESAAAGQGRPEGDDAPDNAPPPAQSRAPSLQLRQRLCLICAVLARHRGDVSVLRLYQSHAKGLSGGEARWLLQQSLACEAFILEQRITGDEAGAGAKPMDFLFFAHCP